MKPDEMTRVIPNWIIAFALLLLLGFMIFSAITGQTFVIAGKEWGVSQSKEPRTLSEASDRSSGGDGQDAMIVLVGSGTVFNYLRELAGDELFSMSDPKVQVLEGGTRTGVSVLSEAYLHGRNPGTFGLLSMASRQLEYEDFAPHEGDRFFEIQVGVDCLEATFGAPSAQAFVEAFGANEIGVRSKVTQRCGRPAITINHLQPYIWSRSGDEWSIQPRYRLFLTSEGSATRELFENALQELTGQAQPAWPDDWTPFDLSVIRVLASGEPWIALGSQLLYTNRLAELRKADLAEQLLVVDSSGQPLERGLYLYGRLTATQDVLGSSGQSVSEGRFSIDPRNARFLSKLFTILEESNLVDLAFKAKLHRQRAFLHLDSAEPTTSWVSEQVGGSTRIYRADE
jgi:hypothetical protein